MGLGGATQNLSVSRTRFLLARILYFLRHRLGLLMFLTFRGRVKAQQTHL